MLLRLFVAIVLSTRSSIELTENGGGVHGRGGLSDASSCMRCKSLALLFVAFNFFAGCQLLVSCHYSVETE